MIGVLQPILTADGAHEVTMSPDESTLVVRYSYKDKPWELYVAPNVKNAKLQSYYKFNYRSFQKLQMEKTRSDYL